MDSKSVSGRPRRSTDHVAAMSNSLALTVLSIASRLGAGISAPWRRKMPVRVADGGLSFGACTGRAPPTPRLVAGTKEERPDGTRLI
jgi:hypothetical protein